MNAHPMPSRAEAGAASGAVLRPRFCPSPTGVPHVGLARTALFAWAAARHAGGQLVFRIEDTDAARDSQESMDAIVSMMSWLGLDHDEGPDIGGPYAPYRQSQRHDRHGEVARLLVEKGYAYESFSTAEEVEARHKAAGRDPKLGYDNFDRDLTDEQKAAYRAEGRDPVIRFRMPDKDITFTDAVRGEVTFAAGMVPDYVIVRGNGVPLYTLVNPLDDADQKVNLVIRGEDLLSSTPRQIALWEAFIELGIAERVPEYAHLPLVVGEDNKKLSKRDPKSDFFHHVRRGIIREGMVNYLALLGWSIAADRDLFTPQELVEHFDIHDVNPNPAHWDQKKCEALNGDHIRALDPLAFTTRLMEYLQDFGHFPKPASTQDMARLKMVSPLVQPRVNVLEEAVPMVGPFFVADDELVVEDDARASLGEGAAAVLDAAIAALEPLDGSMPDIFKEPPTGWTAAPIEAALRAALVDGLGIKPKHAFGPLRVALSGRRVSPPLFESMEVLGKEPTLRRLRNLRASL